MSDPATPVVASAVAAGAVTIPVLAAFGLDPASLVAGLVGCIIIQTLVPPEDGHRRSATSIVLLTVGSVFLASLFAPVVSPTIIERFGSPASAEKIHAFTAGILGMFAQPIVLGLRKVIVPFIVNRVKSFFAPKGGDA